MNKYDEAIKKMCELDYEDLEELLKDGIMQIKIKAYGEGYEQGKFDVEMDSNEGDRLAELAQERRDEIIEKAKKDVEELKDDYDGLYTVDKGGPGFLPHACTAEYIVDKYKRAVIVLMRGMSTGRVRAEGIAKAHPNDCFNVHIGKAIALRRALGLEVPDEYLNAPQPTEARIGDVVDSNSSFGEMVVSHEFDLDKRLINKGMYELLGGTKIVDDSREGE